MKNIQITIVLFLTIIISNKTNAQQHEWQWTRQLGGKGWDIVNDIALDTANNIYMAGSFVDSIQTNGKKTGSHGDRDLFVSKHSPKGELLWLRSAGGKKYDYASCVKVAPSGLIYIAGAIEDTAVFDGKTIAAKAYNLFVACYTDSGAYKWTKTFKALRGDYISQLMFDKQNHIYLAGHFTDSLNFGENIQIISAGRRDIFLAQLDMQGNALWAQRSGGVGDDNIVSAAVDDNNNVYIAGNHQQTANFGKYKIATTNIEHYGVYVAKYNAQGETVWLKSTSEGKINNCRAMAVANDGSFVLATDFANDIIYNKKKYSTKSNNNIIIAAYTSDAKPLWVKQTTDKEASENVLGLSFTKNKQIVITGTFTGSSKFKNAKLSPENAIGNIFTSGYDLAGNQLWINIAASKLENYPRTIITDNDDNIYVAGAFRDELNMNKGTVKSNGEEDIFLAKLIDCSKRKLTIKGDTAFCTGNSVNLTAGKSYQNYDWNNGTATSQSIKVAQSGLYTLKVIDDLNCELKDSLNITENPNPLVSLGHDIEIYQNEYYLLKPDREYAIYLWSDGSAKPQHYFYGAKMPVGTYKIWLQVTNQYGCIAKDSIKLTVKKALGNNSNSINDFKYATFSVYPKPSSGIVNWSIANITTNEFQLSILDQTGKVYKTEQISGYSDNTVQKLDLSILSKGIYFMLFKSNRDERLEKIIIE